MPGKCVYNSSWSEDDSFSSWVKAYAPDKHKAFCMACNKTVDIGGMGKSALKSHAKGPKHCKNLEAMGKSKTNDVQITDFFGKGAEETASGSKSESANPKSKSVHLESHSGKIVTKEMAEETLKAEILWTLHCANRHFSYKAQEENNKIFATMFPDSTIAQNYSCTETKTRYLTTYGLAPHFLSLLKEQVKDKDYVLLFDESLNKKNQTKQLDIHLRFWNDSDHSVCTRYLTSDFIGHSAATDLLESLTTNISSFPLKNVVQLSMDGPSVNWKLFNMLQQRMEKDYKCKFIDTGSCGLHIIHGAFMTGVRETGWGTDDLLSSMYHLFHHAPARQEDYIRVSGSKDFAYKYCKHRWLENVPAIRQALALLDSYEKYVEAVQAKKVTHPKIKSFEVVQESVKDKLLKAKLNFLLSVAQQVQPFLCKYQSDDPLMPFMAADLKNMLTDLMNRFVKSTLVKDKSALEMMKVDLDDSAVLKSYKHVDIGILSDNIVSKLHSERDNGVSDRVILDFRMDCRTMLVRLVKKLFEKCPLQYGIVRNMDCLDPRKMGRDEESSKSHFKRVVKILLEAGRVKEQDCDKVFWQYRDFLGSVVRSNKFLFKEYDPSSVRVDSFLYVHLAGSDTYSELWAIIKVLLSLSHGQASVERGFSVNKYTIEDNLSCAGLVARRVVVDHVRSVGGVLNVTMSKELKLSCRSARQRYSAFLSSSRTVQDPEQLKKRKLEEKEEILRKKKKLEEEMEKLNKNLKDLV